MATMAYPFEMRPLTEAEGGGWLITFPDFPGCLGDGATIEEAVAEDGKMALESVLAVFQEDGRPFPKPGETQSGKFIQRLPKSLHARLATRAKQGRHDDRPCLLASPSVGLPYAPPRWVGIGAIIMTVSLGG